MHFSEQELNWKEALLEKEPDFMQLHKLATLGRLLSGLCHEIRSPLAAILGYSEMVKRASVLDEVSLRRLNKIHDAALRIAKIVDNTLMFSKSQKPNYVLIDLKQVISETIPLFDYHLDETVEINLQLNESDVLIKGDFYQLQQVFFNLIMNAMQATQGKEKGQITISMQVSNSDVEIVLTDNGIGIPEAKLDEIFQPFFTTKSTGTGLGLSIVKSIIDSHGGRMLVESELGIGSSFRITFPLVKNIFNF